MLPKVVVRTPAPHGAYAPLVGVAAVTELREGARRDELVSTLADASGLIAFLHDRIDAALLDAAPSLCVVANYAVGVNNVELEAARARGVWVTNTPDVLTEATAEFTLALVLALLRRVAEGERELRAGRFAGWTPTYLLGEGLAGKTVGLVGFGRIGRAVAVPMHALGAVVLYTGRDRARPEPEPPAGARQVPLAELLCSSDIVSLHVPLDASTRHLIDAAALARMKPSAVLVNTSRGPVVDEAALARALHEGRLAGAAIDVFEREPEVLSELLTAPNALLTPHLASNTRSARLAMGRLAARNVAAVLGGGEPPTAVVRGSRRPDASGSPPASHEGRTG